MAIRPTVLASGTPAPVRFPVTEGRRVASTVLKTAVSVGILGVLLFRIPPSQLFAAAASAGVGGYLGVTLGLIVFLLLGALRVHLTVGAFAQVPFRTVAWLYWRSVALGAFTPGQVGELSLALFLKRRGIDTAQSLAITAVDRCTTLGTLVGLAVLGLLVYLPAAMNVWVWLLLSICAGTVLALYVRPWRKQVRAMVAAVAPSAVPFFEAFCLFFLNHPVRAGSNVLLGLARWVCAAAMLLVIIEPQMPLPVDRLFVMVANAAARLVTYVPISVNGIGVLELSAVELFRLGGIPAQLTFAAFVVNRVVYYLFATAVVFSFMWSHPGPALPDRNESPRSAGQDRDA